MVGEGTYDVFVAKYTDTGAGLSGGGAVGGGSSSFDQGSGIAVAQSGNTNSVYVTGYFNTNSGARIAGSTLVGAGSLDIFVAKYTDSGTGLVGAGARTGGGPRTDGGNAIAVASAGSTTSVYVTGYIESGAPAGVAGTTLTAVGPVNTLDIFVAKYTDSGTGLTSGGAVRAGGTGIEQGAALAATASTVYLATSTFSNMAYFGSSPAMATPPTSGILAPLDAGTLAWQPIAFPLHGGTSIVRDLAVEAGTGNVYLTGYFDGQVAFGDIQLLSAGLSDLFVAKWDATAGAWTSAVQGGGVNDEQAIRIALSSAGGTTTVYVAGSVSSASAGIAGSTLTGTGTNADLFVAKYTDTGTGLTGGGALRGGGSGADDCYGLALSRTGSTTSVYIAGSFGTSANPISIAGTTLTGAGSRDMYVAKYTDNGAGLVGAGAVSGGGTGTDQAEGLAVSSAAGITSVYVTGLFASNTGASIAGTALAGAGGSDMYVAKYTDNGTGLVGNGAVSGGGTGSDSGSIGLALASVGTTTNVYVTGYFGSNTGATIAGTALAGKGNADMYVAKYIDNGTSLANGGAVEGGSAEGVDQGLGLAVSSAAGITSVYVTGLFTSGAGATIAGTTLPGAGARDIFVARYADRGRGLVNRGAVAGGGPAVDQAFAIATGGVGLYIGGSITPTATFGSTTLTTPAATVINVLGRLALPALAPLPVELTQFTAALAGPAAVRLAWATASEQNSQAFEVERSTDGASFAGIGTVAAAGNSSSARAYALLDANPPTHPSTLYYRLRQVDADGTFSYSPVRTVARTGAAAGLSLFPNPAQGGAAILTGAAPGAAVTVYNALGRPVAAATADATGTAALALPAGLPVGVYLARTGVGALRLTVE
ncbi:hypothetical protein ACFST9_15125 [Hymenobacter monticola]|uniref:T9SS type A sorting domain-containing protein n=1 Tax=Hymenobacter monticola TaxID=1705399 RepID=A0ABY4B0Q9_9BACT|nr:T9SS type A sorting domain-containing protein [Hymenobacter monticola]UOE32752.1 T9SS type A sorting domain-containing protein [Hymenobacter monticola]